MANSIAGTPIPDQNAPTNRSNLYSSLLGTVAPSTAEGQFQYGLGQDAITNTKAGLVNTTNQNNATALYNTEQGNIGQAQTNLQGLGLQQQGAQQAAQQGFEQQEYGVQSGQYPEQQAEASLAYNNALMQTQGNNAISGTQNTVGGKNQISTLGQQYGFQLQDINRSQQLAQLGQASEQSGYGFSQQQLQNAQSNLGLISQANGLSQQQTYNMLGSQNQQAGLGAEQQIIQQLSALGSAGLSESQTAGAALSASGFASGINGRAGPE